MTEKRYTYDAKGQPVKMAGWFSWRHQKPDAHESAVARYLARHGKQARRERAAERLANGSDLTRTEREARGSCTRATWGAAR